VLPTFYQPGSEQRVLKNVYISKICQGRETVPDIYYSKCKKVTPCGTGAVWLIQFVGMAASDRWRTQLEKSHYMLSQQYQKLFCSTILDLCEGVVNLRLGKFSNFYLSYICYITGNRTSRWRSRLYRSSVRCLSNESE